MNMQRSRRTVSSTDGVVSDDGSTSGFLNFSQTSHERSNPSVGDEINGGDDDGESLYVNAKTEAGSSLNYSPFATASSHHGRAKASRTRQLARFRGLSKSALKLLSQDDQSLLEMLIVDDMGEINEGPSDVDKVQTALTHVPVQVPVQHTNVATTEQSSALAVNDVASVEHKYSNRIRQLEETLKQKDREAAFNNIQWERTLRTQKEQLEGEFEDKIRDLKNEIARLKVERGGADGAGDTQKKSPTDESSKQEETQEEEDPILVDSRVASLTSDQLSRYSRQLLLSDGWGVQGQLKLLSSSVLVIGAGGIGSTLLLYLASSGVGKITVVDFDKVDMSNLHRQVIHTDGKVGMNKAVSACQAMKELNPTIHCTPVTEMLTFDNAMALVSQHDCVVDACDNPQTRYLVNDACVLSGKPLVSGSAMGTEGQLTLYGHENSACYRCLYPKVNPTEGGKSCSDNGVLGPVPGLIGILQAIETLKLLTGTGATMHDRLLMYDSLRCSFMSIKKPPPRKNCAICGPNASISNMKESEEKSSQARGPQQCRVTPAKVVPPEMNISCADYYQLRRSNTAHVLLDVRVRQQYEMCSLKGSVNIDLESLVTNIEKVNELTCGGTKPIYCICRRGVASTQAARILSNLTSSKVYNIRGGLNSWVADIDESFPMY